MITGSKRRDRRDQRDVGVFDLGQASAQSVPACGQAIRTADWGSHSAGKRTASAHATGSADRRLRADLVGVGLVGDGVDHLVLFEVDGESRVAPAVDRRPLVLLAATRIQAVGRRAEARLDLRPSSCRASGMAAWAPAARGRSAGFRRSRAGRGRAAAKQRKARQTELHGADPHEWANGRCVLADRRRQQATACRRCRRSCIEPQP